MQRKARQARQGNTRQGKATQGHARQYKARRGKAIKGKARQVKARIFKTRQGKVIANPSGYPADLLATVRGRCLVFRPWCQRVCLKLLGTCLELALRGLSRLVDESEFQVTTSDILSTIFNSEFQMTKSDVLSTILSSRSQKVMYCRRF